MLPQRFQCKVLSAGQIQVDTTEYPALNTDLSPYDLQAWVGQEVLIQGVMNGACLIVETVKPRPAAAVSAPPMNNRSGTNLNRVGKKTPVDWKGLWNIQYSIEPPPDQNPPWNSPEDRSQQAIMRIIRFLDVEKTPRFAPRDGWTCCTIFVSDFTRMMHCEIPLDPLGTKKWYNRGANEMIKWIDQIGLKTGGWWELKTPEEAQARANLGYPTIALYLDKTGEPGHVMVVIPGEVQPMQVEIGTKRKPEQITMIVPHMAQAGRNNFSSGRWSKPGIRFITHD